MTNQLKIQGLNDGRFKYNADGTILAHDHFRMEILLTEVSSGFDNADGSKVSFDHYKAMFGMLAMLKTLAHTYNKASFATFKKLKIHFIHGHGNVIRHWTMSLQSPGVFVMNKEQRVTVPIKFVEKDMQLLPFICFYKTLTIACEDTLLTLKQLKEEHKYALRSKDTESTLTLDILVDPMIIRLNEAKHASIVASEGPQSQPSSPSR
ncbi:hypothetical protein DM01DRAFT_252525 [Hesseltinella vesiculosa]|uniref:Uncharacterized protein n=1 Tax=Hesseltinella vesiculosa TaxID=101127 RepID=A0A1X2G9N8_9FUNG|nr:hypothetical protein DM01DRAFT_252525 [Hesseltinella vesiculosa]